MKPTRAGLFRTWPRLARSDAIDPELTIEKDCGDLASDAFPDTFDILTDAHVRRVLMRIRAFASVATALLLPGSRRLP